MMMLTFLLILVLVIMVIGLIQSIFRVRELQETTYNHGLVLLGTFDDVDGTYSCLDPDTAVSIGIYLVTIGER